MTDSSEAHIAEQLSQATILLADDSPFMLELMSAMLKAFGATRIERAANGEQALQMIQDRHFDVVIADWQMQPMDGHAFLKRLRHELRGNAQRLPVVMCTAYTDRERVLMLRDAGANEVLTKPVSPAAVYEKLMRALFQPRPFVVSGKYVGPDRRRRARPIDFPDRRRRNLAQAAGGEDMFL